MKITSTKERHVNFIRALNHGASGIGKTTSLSTLPQNMTLIAACERSLIPLRKHGYPVVMLESWDDVRELIGKMRKPADMLSELKEANVVPDDFTEIKILAIDSLSELSDMCKRQIVEVDRRRLVSERTKGKSDRPESIYDEQMSMEDWGLYGTRMKNLLATLGKLPVHIVMTSLSDRTEDKRTGEMLYGPNLAGKIAQECPAYFDVVVHMESIEEATDEGKKNVRMFRTLNNGKVLAKDASGVLAEFEEPNWTQVFGKILGTNGNGSHKKGGSK